MTLSTLIVLVRRGACGDGELDPREPDNILCLSLNAALNALPTPPNIMAYCRILFQYWCAVY